MNSYLKRGIAVLLAGTMSLSLAACGKKGGDDSKNTASGNSTSSLAQELGGFGITVNAIAAGLTAGTASSAATTEDVRERIIAMTPLGRLARPDDIAGGVALLASDMAGFITGQCLHVDGGLTMR